MKTPLFFRKLLLCLLAGLVGGATFLRIGNRFLSRWVPIEIIFSMALMILLASIVCAFLWHFRERRSSGGPLNTEIFWVDWIRFGIALDLAMFGFQKIFHLQFLTPLGMLDEPHSSFSGEWLTWSYFGYSYPFAVLIGLLQIVGSFLLLFRRTRLLGLMIILPVLLNIALIDFFYGLAPGVLAHALIMLSAAVYVLLRDYDRLLAFFIHHREGGPSVVNDRRLKGFLRLSILFLPLILISLNDSPNKNPELRGKYKVVEMSINDKPVMANTCSDSLLTLVYLDLENECVFEFNSQKRRLFGRYELDRKDKFSVAWHYPQHIKDAFAGTILKQNGGLVLIGSMGNSSLKVRLARE